TTARLLAATGRMLTAGHVAAAALLAARIDEGAPGRPGLQHQRWRGRRRRRLRGKPQLGAGRSARIDEGRRRRRVVAVARRPLHRRVLGDSATESRARDVAPEWTYWHV